MKTKVFILGIISVILISGCLKEDEPSKDWSEEINLQVSPQYVDYRPFGADAPLKGISIKEENSNRWSAVHPRGIKGFEYVEGYEYHLKVLKTHLWNPPMDASNVRYELINVISKNKIN